MRKARGLSITIATKRFGDGIHVGPDGTRVFDRDSNRHLWAVARLAKDVTAQAKINTPGDKPAGEGGEHGHNHMPAMQ